MAFCPKCSTFVPDGTAICPSCGTQVTVAAPGAEVPPQQAPQAPQAPNYQQQVPYQPYPAPVPVPVKAPTDHTDEFDAKDISDNKVMAMAPYVLSVFGIIIALMAAPQSPFTAFHVRQAMKINICITLLGICATVLGWTIIVPVAAVVCIIILAVVSIIQFFRVCSGRATEAPIVSSLGFLK